MCREVRCQAVILKDNLIVVMKQFNYRRGEEYWLLPGGGLEKGETEEECIKREIKEETNLEVVVKGVLFDEPSNGEDVYKRYVTFLCSPLEESTEKIGSETVDYRKIIEIVWCSLEDESTWNEYLLKEQFYPSMKRIKEKLISQI